VLPAIYLCLISDTMLLALFTLRILTFAFNNLNHLMTAFYLIAKLFYQPNAVSLRFNFCLTKFRYWG